MIIGKKDKEKFKQLENTNRLLNDEHFQRMYRDDLVQLIKAIINKFGTKEITVDIKEIENAKQLELYVTDEILRRARKYQVINPKQLLHSYNEGEEER